MLSEEEKQFLDYWTKNRDRQRKTYRQFLLGIPAGLLIAIPIVLSLVSGWYKRATMEANASENSPGVLLVALLIIVSFMAILSKKFSWEKHEQRFLELLDRQQREKEKEES